MNPTAGLTISKSTSWDNIPTGGFFSADNSASRLLPIVFAINDLVIQTGYTGETLLMEAGANGIGMAVEISNTRSSIDFSAGSGAESSTANDVNERVFVSIPFSSISFDTAFQLTYEVDAPNGTARAWIDDDLVADVTSPDGTLEDDKWAGGNGDRFKGANGATVVWLTDTTGDGLTTSPGDLDFYEDQLSTWSPISIPVFAHHYRTLARV